MFIPLIETNAFEISYNTNNISTTPRIVIDVSITVSFNNFELLQYVVETFFDARIKTSKIMQNTHDIKYSKNFV